MDTLEKIDPKSLKMVGTISAAYAYFLANASDAEAQWLSYELVSRFKNEVIKLVQDTISRVLELKVTHISSPLMGEDKGGGEISPNKHPPLAPTIKGGGDMGKFQFEDSKVIAKLFTNTEQKLVLLLEQKTKALVSIERLGGISSIVNDLRIEMKELVEKELNQMKKVLGIRTVKAGIPKKNKMDRIAEKMIPKRIYRGPISLRSFSYKLNSKDRDKLHELRTKYQKRFDPLTALAQYWVDGKRNLLEIIDLVELETGIRASEFLVEYFRILKKLKLVSISKK
jgi:hypothetical protein